MKKTNTFIPKNKLTSRDRIYQIHDNGGRPFQVIANNNGIFVFELTDTFKTKDNKYKFKYNKQILKFQRFLGFWSGYDTSPSSMHGNSILIQISKNEYVYIGMIIVSFKTEDEIIDYVSHVGGSDVPYPVAFGENNVYFMNEGQYIKNKELVTPITVKDASDLYEEFYGRREKKNHKKHHIKSKVLVNRFERYPEVL